MKKVLSVILAIIMMLSAFSVMPVSAAEKVDYTMVTGETKEVSLSNTAYPGYVIVKYVAPAKGKVAISSDGKLYATCNIVLDVHKGSMNNFICKVEGNGKTKHDFYYEFNCEAGDVYYFAMHNSLSGKTWDVSIACLHETYSSGVCSLCAVACDHSGGNNLVGLCPCGAKYNGEAIAVGNKYTMESNVQYKWFGFVPSKTAMYILKSENPDNDKTILSKAADPSFVIVDKTGNNILVNDANIGADNRNFDLIYNFTAGETYFIGVRDNALNSDDWHFTLVDGSVHTTEVTKEVQKEVVDADGNVVTDADGNVVYENVTVTETVEHTLTYIPQKNATCQEAGCTAIIVCESCKDSNNNSVVFSGGYTIAKLENCVDADKNNRCDMCEKIIDEDAEDPTKNCDCNCHKKGIAKFFFNFALFFQRIFRANKECDCGIEHY